MALMDTFEAAREEQTRLLEQKQTELDRLVSGLDRTTRLNETDKEDLTNEVRQEELYQEHIIYLFLLLFCAIHVLLLPEYISYQLNHILLTLCL